MVKEKVMEQLKSISGVILVVLVVVGAGSLSRYLSTNNTESNTDGLSYTLEAFNAPCVAEATKGGNVSKEVATQYCTCVYDKGIAEYGGEGWANELIKADAEGFTPKINEFVNQCIVTTMGSESV